MSKLRTQLLAAMAPNAVFRAPVWGSPRAMTEALREVRKTLASGDLAETDTQVLQTALRRFATTRAVGSFTELKYICHGVTVPVGDWRLIDRKPLFDSLLGLVEQRSGQSKQYRRCYQGLLTGYFGFDKQGAESEGQANWVQLRGFLHERLTPIVQATARTGLELDWLKTLDAHRNLLTAEPCERYAAELRQGKTDELHTLCGALGIASTSWVWDEALMAYVRAVCGGMDDRRFQKDMKGVLDLANGRTDLRLAEMLCTRATALTVVRYARCTEPVEHAELRDTSLRWIGNPWVSRTAWDAHVQFEPARQMVEGWIKRRVIKDFFELLAHDGGADLRRLNYWLKWEPQITDMWFVLGWDARANRSEAFKELRDRMVGRRRSLGDHNGQNNAFVMRIGPLLVIEFGVTGNACYAFAAADFKGNLDQPELSIHELKQRLGARRLSHAGSWESKFDYELRRLLQSVPASKGQLREQPAPGKKPAAATSDTVAPVKTAFSFARGLQPAAPALHAAAGSAASSAERLFQVVRATQQPQAGSGGFSVTMTSVIKERCIKDGIDWEDNRPKGGAFWVLLPNRILRPGLASLLESHGFQLSAGKGFWIKDKA